MDEWRGKGGMFLPSAKWAMGIFPFSHHLFFAIQLNQWNLQWIKGNINIPLLVIMISLTRGLVEFALVNGSMKVLLVNLFSLLPTYFFVQFQPCLFFIVEI